MSQENVEVVRQPIVVRAETHRDLDQRLYVLLPGAAAALYRVSWRWVRSLSPRSRLRKAVIRTLVRRAAETVNRRDFDQLAIFTHAEIESFNNPQVVALGGLVPGTHGRDAWVAGQRRWLDEWEVFRYEPDEVLDLGEDRILLLGRVRGIGGRSGAVVDSEWGLVADIADGLLAREQNFLDRAEALEAVGLSE